MNDIFKNIMFSNHDIYKLYTFTNYHSKYFILAIFLLKKLVNSLFGILVVSEYFYL